MGKEIAAQKFDLADKTLFKQIADWLIQYVTGRKGQIRIVVETAGDTPSDDQRRYYHGHLVEVLADFLEDNQQPIPEGLQSYHDFAHEMLKLRCNSIPVFDKHGRLIDHVVRSTEALTVAEREKFHTRCRTYMDGLGLTTYDPNKNWQIEQPSRHRVPAGGATA